MEKRDKPKPRRTPLEWRSFPYWYLLLMLVLLWLWQGAFMQFSVQSIAYSEFKEHLRNREVVECAVKENVIDGRIEPKADAAATAEVKAPATPKDGKATDKSTAKGADKTKPFFFRTVRVEDPKLIEELEQAGVKFTGVRPGLLGQFLLSWVVPIVVMVMLWTFLSRRLGRAGESILSFGKSRARLVVDA